MNQEPIRLKCVKLIGRLIKPFVEEGVITVAEEGEILLNLRHLSAKGMLKPAIVPKLINTNEAAEMLNITGTAFRNFERQGVFSFKRKMVGNSVKYRNTDLISFILDVDNGS